MRRVRLILAELTDAPVPSNFPGVFLVLFRMGKNAYRVRCSKDTNLKRVIIGTRPRTQPTFARR